MERDNDSEANDSNRDDLTKNVSSKESRKSAVTANRRSSGRDEKVKKFNCKKGERAKARRKNLHHASTHDHPEVGMEEHGNIRNVYVTIMSGNGKADTMFHSMAH